MSQEIAPVLCDGCGADITDTGNSVDYRLVLRSESKMPWYVRQGLDSGMVTDMHIPDPLPSNKHFCGLRCLHRWVNEEV